MTTAGSSSSIRVPSPTDARSHTAESSAAQISRLLPSTPCAHSSLPCFSPPCLSVPATHFLAAQTAPASVDSRLAAQNALFEELYQADLEECPRARHRLRRLSLQRPALRPLPRRYRTSPHRRTSPTSTASKPSRPPVSPSRTSSPTISSPVSSSSASMTTNSKSTRCPSTR